MLSARIRAMGFLIAAIASLCAAPVGLPAQSVRLELRPRVGDTLMLRIEQQTEIIGAILRPQGDSTQIRMQTSMLMYARAVVERADDSAAVVMAVTDSVTLKSSSPEDGPNLQELERSIEGKRVYMRVLPDGSSDLLRADAAVSSVIRAVIADMPSTLPLGPVEVGSTWQRVVKVPLEAGAGPHMVRTTFRLDSLSPSQQLAYISMRGLIIEEPPPKPELPAASGRNSTSGDMKGNMTLDRKRGWIINSVATITLNAVVKRPLESNGLPMNFQFRITQQMRTLNSR